MTHVKIFYKSKLIMNVYSLIDGVFFAAVGNVMHLNSMFNLKEIGHNLIGNNRLFNAFVGYFFLYFCTR